MYKDMIIYKQNNISEEILFGDDETNRMTIDAIQREETLWAGPSLWKGRSGMRFSVSSWKTTEADIDRCIAAIAEISTAVKESMV